MITQIQKLQKLLINHKEENKSFSKVLKHYRFLYISDILDPDDNLDIKQKIINSKVITINHIEINSYKEELYFIIGFKHTILVVESSHLEYLHKLLSLRKGILEICFITDKKYIIANSIKLEYKETENNEKLQTEFSSFNNYLILKTPKIIHSLKIWRNIIPCISSYAIYACYHMSNKDRYIKFGRKKKVKFSPRILNEENCIVLRNIGFGSLFAVELIYSIDYECFYAVKKKNCIDEEVEKLEKRERENYSKLNHPLIPKFYGTTCKENHLVIEYINGSTLREIKSLHLSEFDKILSILQLFSVFKHFHENNFIYRDLKPNNVMIDQNRNIVIIDFDRLITQGNARTRNFPSIFQAPEVNSDEISTKCDIYSLGKMIYYILNEEIPDEKESKELFKKEYRMFQHIYDKCTKIKCDERPSISELIVDFYSVIINGNNEITNRITGASFNDCNSYENIDIICKFIHYHFAADQNDAHAQKNLGIFYAKGEFIERNINKAIHYYILAANQNNAIAQSILGNVYLRGEFVERDINKAIHYYILAANQNNAIAQFNLGNVYLRGEFVERDINKAIHYFSLAANQNDTHAQFNLGTLYEKGLFVERDINKAIHYFTLAANHNDIRAQFILGTLYEKGLFVERNINKMIYYYSLASNQNDAHAHFILGNIYLEAIHYYSLAANQNEPRAQNNLGNLYAQGELVERNFSKALYYYTLAANLNYDHAQFNLGNLYLREEFINYDVDKAIHYFTLAANQNHSDAQFNLGVLYEKGKFVERDIDKAIQYYSLAANQNHANALNYLGNFYLKSGFVDIDKAIHYFSLAANQNHADAQFNLGNLYLGNELVERNIDKAIHYFTLAANQNHAGAQNNLGVLYVRGELVEYDIKKAIHYFSLAAFQNFADAQNNLGIIYGEGKLVKQDINKAIHYFSLAAHQNHPDAQNNLGSIYYSGCNAEKNILKGIYWIEMSSKNRNKDAIFSLGFLFHEGKHVKRDISKSIHFYKDASNLNNHLAKNNLGVLYKYGYEKEVLPTFGGIVYFEEAIKEKSDPVAMHNLSNIYIYELSSEENFNKAIKLLIQSSKQGFNCSSEFLCILMIKKYGVDIKKILMELLEHDDCTDQFLLSILDIIFDDMLYNETILEKYYQLYQNTHFLYNFSGQVITLEDLLKQKYEAKSDQDKRSNINNYFYEGFYK
ncbi:hypothetical protein M9Y10_038920 [Tritrichomonas musculus]|uniref:Protein kinase domain-containing protein n=1 Tax=Tritrichomonas musculus TaxID=1915356 RepID=A0ABR2K9S8_9EUKA